MYSNTRGLSSEEERVLRRFRPLTPARHRSLSLQEETSKEKGRRYSSFATFEDFKRNMSDYDESVNYPYSNRNRSINISRGRSYLSPPSNKKRYDSPEQIYQIRREIGIEQPHGRYGRFKTTKYPSPHLRELRSLSARLQPRDIMVYLRDH